MNSDKGDGKNIFSFMLPSGVVLSPGIFIKKNDDQYLIISLTIDFASVSSILYK